MQNETTKKGAKKQRKNDTTTQERRGETSQNPSQALASIAGETIGTFQLGALGQGEAKLVQDADHVRIGFELVLADEVAPTGVLPELSIDLVVGPPNWHSHAEVYEVKSVPVLGNSAIIEIDRADLARIAQDGRVQFYGRVHTGSGETHYLNRGGRAFENFEIAI